MRLVHRVINQKIKLMDSVNPKRAHLSPPPPPGHMSGICQKTSARGRSFVNSSSSGTIFHLFLIVML